MSLALDAAMDRPCRDCGGVAEEERDGAYRYWACVDCGYCFGYERVEAPEPECQLGVPAAVRSAVPVSLRAKGG